MPIAQWRGFNSPQLRIPRGNSSFFNNMFSNTSNYLDRIEALKQKEKDIQQSKQFQKEMEDIRYQHSMARQQEANKPAYYKADITKSYYEKMLDNMRRKNDIDENYKKGLLANKKAEIEALKQQAKLRRSNKLTDSQDYNLYKAKAQSDIFSLYKYDPVPDKSNIIGREVSQEANIKFGNQYAKLFRDNNKKAKKVFDKLSSYVTDDKLLKELKDKYLHNYSITKDDINKLDFKDTTFINKGEKIIANRQKEYLIDLLKNKNRFIQDVQKQYNQLPKDKINYGTKDQINIGATLKELIKKRDLLADVVAYPDEYIEEYDIEPVNQEQAFIALDEVNKKIDYLTKLQSDNQALQQKAKTQLDTSTANILKQRELTAQNLTKSFCNNNESECDTPDKASSVYKKILNNLNNQIDIDEIIQKLKRK